MSGFIKKREEKKIEHIMKKKLGKDYYKPHGEDEALLDEELRDRGKLTRIVCLIAAAVLLLGIIGTVSVVNVTYEQREEEMPLAAEVTGAGKNEETIAQLEEVQKYLDYLGSSVDDSNMTLHTLYKDQNNEERQSQIREHMTTISERMNSLDREIIDLKSEVTALISDLRSEEGITKEEYTARFSQISDRVSGLSAALDSSVSDISSLISHLQGTQEKDHESLIAALGSMKNALSSGQDQSLSTLKELLGTLNTDMLAKFEALSENTELKLDRMNTDITNRFNTLNTDITNRFNTLNTDITNQFDVSVNGENGIKALVQSGFADVNTKLNSVFQSVADGKSLLATALATKGQTVAPDATFTQIRDAILGIRQQLVIGVSQLPGEIEYRYHYHVDGEGNRVNEDSIDTCGGCYTVGFHVHTSSCPLVSYQVFDGYGGHDVGTTRDSCSECGAPIDHTGGTGSCPNARPSYHTESYYTCGNLPINRYSRSCDLADGQIVGASIRYVNYDSLPESSITYVAASGSSSSGSGTSAGNQTHGMSGMMGSMAPLSLSGRSLGTAALPDTDRILNVPLSGEDPAGISVTTAEETGEEDASEDTDVPGGEAGIPGEEDRLPGEERNGTGSSAEGGAESILQEGTESTSDSGENSGEGEEEPGENGIPSGGERGTDSGSGKETPVTE